MTEYQQRNCICRPFTVQSILLNIYTTCLPRSQMLNNWLWTRVPWLFQLFQSKSINECFFHLFDVIEWFEISLMLSRGVPGKRWLGYFGILMMRFSWRCMNWSWHWGMNGWWAGNNKTLVGEVEQMIYRPTDVCKQHQKKYRPLLSARFFTMISPTKFGCLGLFHFWEVVLGF